MMNVRHRRTMLAGPWRLGKVARVKIEAFREAIRTAEQFPLVALMRNGKKLSIRSPEHVAIPPASLGEAADLVVVYAKGGGFKLIELADVARVEKEVGRDGITPRTIRDRLWEIPFRPFAIRLADGNTHEIDHPSRALVTVSGVVVGTDPVGGIPRKHVTCPTANIAEVFDIPGGQNAKP